MSTHNPGEQSDVSLTVTSKPVEDETPINIDAKSDSQNIKFHDHAQVGFLGFYFHITSKLGNVLTVIRREDCKEVITYRFLS